MPSSPPPPFTRLLDLLQHQSTHHQSHFITLQQDSLPPLLRPTQQVSRTLFLTYITIRSNYWLPRRYCAVTRLFPLRYGMVWLQPTHRICLQKNLIYDLTWPPTSFMPSSPTNIQPNPISTPRNGGWEKGNVGHSTNSPHFLCVSAQGLPTMVSGC